MITKSQEPGKAPVGDDPAGTDPVKTRDDGQLDVAEEDSFPASDPPSITDPTKTVGRPEQGSSRVRATGDVEEGAR